MKHILLLPILLLSAAAWSAVYPVTETFNNSSSLLSNWTDLAQTNSGYVPLQQNNGVAIPSVAGQQGMAIYTAATFPNDQYSQVKFLSPGASTGSSTGTCVHMSATGDGVCYLADIGLLYLLSGGNGAGDINSSCPIPASGDTIQLSVVGTTYTCSDLTTGASSSTTNSVFPSGSPAILVDQRPSTSYALAQFQADCIPSCFSAPSSGTPSTPNTSPSTPPSTPSSGGPSDPSAGGPSDPGNPPPPSNPGPSSPSVASAPILSLPSGTYTPGQTVSITSLTPSATIYYTTDGSQPTTASAVYSGPLTISASETINAIAVAAGFDTSAVGSAIYTIAAPSGGSTSGQTWYVNGGGGTRYSSNQPGGQCNGKSPAAYPGSGVNQDCAFKDIRSLWTDGSYVTDTGAGSPAWGWIGSSGDTYLVDCSGGALCRIGQNGPNAQDFYGLAGNPYGAGMPPPINGTPSAHTRLLGVNYQSCTSPAAKAHINGGFGVSTVLSLQNTSYVDVACFDITDFSSCGKSGQASTCNTVYPISDFATNGIVTNPSTTNTTITDVSIHGMANVGIQGATGDGVVLTRVSLSGNPGAGWNMDDGSGATGWGHLTLSYFSVQWSGCAEQYPIVDALPYADCTDDNSGGYGDGIGTATVNSHPGWIMSIDHSVAAYNTQDGFDLLHLQGGGSTLTITNSLAYGNMGQQVKMGAAGTAIDNLFVGNCNALRQAIPGTPSGYNARLSDFCRASDTPVVVAVGDGGLTRYINNTLYTAGSIGVEVTNSGPCTTNCFFQYENNIFLGFPNNAANGYPNGGSGKLPAPIYFDSGNPILGQSGSTFTNNLTWNARDSWPCPQTSWNEQNAVCADPGLVDETFHLYGFGNMSPAAPSSIVVGKGISIPGVSIDFSNSNRSSAPTIGAYEGTASSASLP
jgi:hypothetical protein